MASPADRAARDPKGGLALYLVNAWVARMALALVLVRAHVSWRALSPAASCVRTRPRPRYGQAPGV